MDEKNSPPDEYDLNKKLEFATDVFISNIRAQNEHHIAEVRRIRAKREDLYTGYTERLAENYEEKLRNCKITIFFNGFVVGAIVAAGAVIALSAVCPSCL